MTKRIKTISGAFLAAGLLAAAYFWIQHVNNAAAFVVAPGAAVTREDLVKGRNLLPGKEGLEFGDVSPVQISAPPFIKCEVLNAYSGGHYQDLSWHPKSVIKYSISVLAGAPKGKYSVAIAFPSGYTHKIHFLVRP